MPAIGDLLGGKYRVAARLGEGGMGAVFQAENVLTGKQVAIKWMHPHVAARAEAVSRLLREAQAASRIDHPNIVDVYDIVQDGDVLFMVMELLQGETLRAYLGRTPPPKVSEFIALLLPALDGVAVAHENGVIHRDLKPDNIFIVHGRSGRRVTAKVLDFGIAKLASWQGVTLTESGVMMGTPLYMSLEQLRGDRDVDIRTDVYAFGAMLYEAVTGETPFRADTMPELVFKIATTEARPVKERRPDLPTSLTRVIDWAIARERNRRLPDLRALMLELEPFARDQGFFQQMTNPDVALPRLAARTVEPDAHFDTTGTIQQVIAPRARRDGAGAARKASVQNAGNQSDPDTLKARVVDPQRTATKRSPILWLAGALVLGAGLAGLAWLKISPGDAGPAVAAPTSVIVPAPAPPRPPRIDDTSRTAAAQPAPAPAQVAPAANEPPGGRGSAGFEDGPAARAPEAAAPVTGTKAAAVTLQPRAAPAPEKAAVRSPPKPARHRTPQAVQPAPARKSAAELLAF